MKKPNLKVIENKKFKAGEIRKHLSSVVDNAFNYESPPVGYAMVIFHENKAYTANFHLTESGIHQIDMPDMVKNRLQELAINVTKR